MTRAALLYVPRHVWRRGGLPLVLVLHGGASSPETIARMSEMHQIAEREGFIVAYPAGTPGKSGLTWHPAGSGTARKTGDTRFIRALIADLRQHHEIDSARIFAAGFSIGGSLVYELSCLLDDQIAAGAVVGGAMTTIYRDPSRPVSLIHIHGTKDRRVPLEGGRGPATRRPSEWLPVRAGIERWCRINQCASEPQVVWLGEQGVTGYRYLGAADVELWLVECGHHVWPGGGDEAPEAERKPLPVGGFSASEKIWSFFAAHPRRATAYAPPSPLADARADDA